MTTTAPTPQPWRPIAVPTTAYRVVDGVPHQPDDVPEFATPRATAHGDTVRITLGYSEAELTTTQAQALANELGHSIADARAYRARAEGSQA